MAAPLILTVPADPAYVVVLRAATAAVASRAGFGLDQIEDLRLAVDELAALALAEPSTADDLQLSLDESDAGLVLRLRFGGSALPEDGFGWMVLRSLAASAEQVAEDGHVTVTLHAVGQSG
jgi:serine/threonine-protein kinase RsbW